MNVSFVTWQTLLSLSKISLKVHKERTNNSIRFPALSNVELVKRWGHHCSFRQTNYIQEQNSRAFMGLLNSAWCHCIQSRDMRLCWAQKHNGSSLLACRQPVEPRVQHSRINGKGLQNFGARWYWFGFSPFFFSTVWVKLLVVNPHLSWE